MVSNIPKVCIVNNVFVCYNFDFLIIFMLYLKIKCSKCCSCLIFEELKELVSTNCDQISTALYQRIFMVKLI